MKENRYSLHVYSGVQLRCDNRRDTNGWYAKTNRKPEARAHDQKPLATILKSNRARLTTCLILALATIAGQSAAEEAEPGPEPELLEFIAEFEDVDDETFNLLIDHAVEDSKHTRTEEKDAGHSARQSLKEAKKDEKR